MKKEPEAFGLLFIERENSYEKENINMSFMSGTVLSQY